MCADAMWVTAQHICICISGLLKQPGRDEVVSETTRYTSRLSERGKQPDVVTSHDSAAAAVEVIVSLCVHYLLASHSVEWLACIQDITDYMLYLTARNVDIWLPVGLLIIIERSFTVHVTIKCQ